MVIIVKTLKQYKMVINRKQSFRNFCNHIAQPHEQFLTSSTTLGNINTYFVKKKRKKKKGITVQVA